MWLFVTNSKSAWPTDFGTLVWWAWLEVVKLLAPEYGVQYHNHHNYIYRVNCLPCAYKYLWRKCLFMSFRSGCAFFAISDCPYSLGMSCLHVRLAVSFHVTCTRSVSPWGPLAMSSSRVHSQLENATFVKGQRVSMEHTVSSLLNSQDCWFCQTHFIK